MYEQSRHEGFGAVLFSFAISLALNAAVYTAVDKAALPAGKPRLEALRTRAIIQKKNGKDRMEFSFVEAPPDTFSKTPSNRKKISDRNALARDQSANVAHPERTPATKQLGPSDQLAQMRVKGRPAGPPAPSAETAQPSPPKPGKPKPDPGQGQEVTLPPKPQVISSPPTSPPAEGLTGRDKITTAEMGRTVSKGVRLYGQTSFEATGCGMGEYLKNMKEKIWLAWFPYLSFTYPNDFQTADAILSLTLDADGRVKIVRVVQFAGSRAFADFCVEAVQRASDFGPLPKDILALLGKNEFELKFGFHYK